MINLIVIVTGFEPVAWQETDPINTCCIVGFTDVISFSKESG